MAIPELLYVALVLGADAARGGAEGFDLFELLTWLVIPALWTYRRWDAGFYGVTRWRRGDWWALAAMAGAIPLLLAAVAYVPSLRDYYLAESIPPAARPAFVRGELLWILSWLPGWEFLHRFFLLGAVRRRWPRHGWWAVPIAETLYHLQKPLPETAAMLVFSVAMTFWTVRRNNGLLPLLVHLLVELTLLGLVLSW